MLQIHETFWVNFKHCVSLANDTIYISEESKMQITFWAAPQNYILQDRS